MLRLPSKSVVRGMGNPASDIPGRAAVMKIETTTPTEPELILLAKNGSDEAFEAIVRRYEWLVRARARSYFLQGADYEDLIQEGMIGLFKAVRDFRENGAAFTAFADLCITRQIITAVKTASRRKHLPLNSAFSLEAPRYEGDGDRTVGDTVSDRAMPFDIALLQTAEVRNIMNTLRQHLSAFEYSALSLWLEGRSFKEIARRLGKHVKSVDNGLWRVKCKIRRLLDAGRIPRGDL